MARSRASTWSYKTGEWGCNRIRLAEDLGRGGRLFVEFREDDGRKVRQYLAHRDRERAKAEADAMAVAFRTEATPRSVPRTLQALFDIYLTEVTPTKTPGTQQHDRATAQLFLRVFGADRKPLTLSLRDWQSFVTRRRSGRLAPKGPKGVPRLRSVGDRAIAYDLKFLMAVFNWATLAGDGEGGVLLEKNPCTGFPVPAEANPRRPRMSETRYRKMLAVAPEVSSDFHLALVLAHETGHRLSSIRRLWWSDIWWDEMLIQWRAEADKEENHHFTPLTQAAFEALQHAKNQALTLGNTWIFVERRPYAGLSASRPRRRERFINWWLRAEELAKLPRVAGMGWHSLRRKFATELKHIPLTDLCELGGWKTAETVLTCYQQADPHTMRRALLDRRHIEGSVSRGGQLESTIGEQRAKNRTPSALSTANGVEV